MGWFGPSGDCGCCGECSCTEFAPSPTTCQCQTDDYGTIKTYGTLTVTISGSFTPTAATSPTCSAPASCGSVNGTYVIACTDDRDQDWRIDTFVCTSGGFDYYYANTLRIIYQVGPLLAVTVRIGSVKVRLNAGDPNPYPTLTAWAGPQATSGGTVVLQYQAVDTNQTKERWTYVLGGDCREECNFPTTIAECNKLSGSLTLTQSYVAGSGSTDNVCHPSSLTVTASLSAPA